MLYPPSNRQAGPPVVEDAVVTARPRVPAQIQGRRKPRRESPTARGVPQLVGMAAPPGAEQVALVAERQAAGVEAQRELPQLTFGAGITDGQIEMDRRFREMPQPRGVHPQGARVADIGGMEIERGVVRGDLGERARRQEQERKEQSDPPSVPPSAHYGNTATVVRVTWITGTATPWTGSRTVRVVESCHSPPR